MNADNVVEAVQRAMVEVSEDYGFGYLKWHPVTGIEAVKRLAEGNGIKVRRFGGQALVDARQRLFRPTTYALCLLYKVSGESVYEVLSEALMKIGSQEGEK